MKNKNILSTKWGKLLLSGGFIIIIATLTNFFPEESFMLDILALLFGLSLLYPIWYFLSTVFYAVKKLFKK